jgi:polyisoprenoid-binding protein YceI
MKKVFALVFLALSVFAVKAQTAWTLDNAHSNVKFSVSHMVISELEGNFKKYSAVVTADKADFSDLQVTFTIEANSVNTDNENRDKHLASDDFFNSEKFPQIIFKSTSVKMGKNGDFELTGNLTMKGVTKKVTWKSHFNGVTKDPYGNTRAGFKSTLTINRQDYGLAWSKSLDSGGAVVGDDVTITVTTEITKK